MIARVPRSRSGITLTEILMSILIMGVGMISLAVLFPVGLLRLQWAGRLSRSAYLGESAIDDVSTRGLFNSASFTNVYYSPWYNGVNPWIQDTPSYGSGPAGGAFRSVGPGLPVAYDPLWRYQTNFASGGYYLGAAMEARFGSGIGVIAAESGDGGAPSVYGLQRLTNFNPKYYATLGVPNPVPDIFVSPEDMIFESGEAVAPNSVNVSPVVPDLGISGNGLPTNDWRYTWFFTGQQTDANNTTVFNDDIVVCENREFNIETINVNGTQVQHVAGETTVEGIFGYSPNPYIPPGASFGFALSATNTVVLRWPASMDDPDIKDGSWIADVTYERNAKTDQQKMSSMTGAYPQLPATQLSGPNVTIPPMQRCYWYQVAKRNPVGPDVLGNSGYRSRTIWTVTPLRAQTPLQAGGAPAYANAALIMPSVVNVYSHTFYTH